MLTVGEAEKVRDSLRDELHAVARADQRAWLLSTIAGIKNVDGDRLLIRRAFAQIYLVQRMLHVSFDEGLAALTKAHTALTALAEENRRIRIFAKDCSIFLGNLFAENGQPQKAIEQYTDAIRNEHDYNRRAMGQLNIARALMADGRMYEALRVAEKIDLPRIDSARLRQYFQLMRARILLTLGFEDQATNVVATMSEIAADATIDVERRYLALMAAIDFGEPMPFLAACRSFSEWVAAHCEERVHQFYELEIMVYRCLIDPVSVGNKEHFLTRARYLATKVDGKAILDVLQGLVTFLFKADKGEDAFERLLQELSLLATASNYRMFQVTSMLLGRELVATRRYRCLDDLLAKVKTHREAIRMGFTEKLLKSLDKDRNGLRDYEAKLRGLLPQSYRHADARIESILLPGAGIKG